MGPADEFAHALSQRIHCEDSRGQHLAAQLRNLPPTLQVALRTWWDTQSVPEQPVIMGFSAKRLIEDGVCKSVAVSLLWLNALMEHPQRTIEHIQAGYDEVVWGPEAT